MDADQVQIVVTAGSFTDEVKQRAGNLVADLERFAPREFLHADVQLAELPTQEPPVSGHVVLDVQGRIVQARCRADHANACLDRLEAQLENRLRRLAERLQTREYEPAVVPEGQWRHGALPTDRPDHFPRPEEERQFVERTTHARRLSSAEEAAFDLDLLEDDWLLYVDDSTRTDAVVRRADDDASRAVTAIGGTPAVHDDGPYRWRLEAAPPELTVDDAVERLRVGDESHVFFVDPVTGRGAVVYWRYDGHYGLVRPRPDTPGAPTTGDSDA